MEYYFDEIESIEEIGQFENEYVYDLEMNDSTHTFIANDILVHNSLFLSFKPLLNSCDWTGDPKDFILKLAELRLNKYFIEKFDEYAKRFNTINIQNFELEKIARSALIIAKKKYILDLAWKDPGITFGPQEKITFTGVEIRQSSTPRFAKKVLMDLVFYIFKEGKALNYAQVIKKLKDIKKEFCMQPTDDIAKAQSLGDYEKYVLDDRKQILLADKCPMNNRAAAIYNYSLFNSKYKSKYNSVKTGEKIKFYYAKNQYGIFGFQPGNFPYEFAPELDYDLQFEKIIIEPFNRFFEILGFNAIQSNLVYNIGLF